MTRPLVTIAIPVHKRLHYLPGALRSVAAQDYGNIELIVSDNGLNGAEVRNIVQAHYGRPWRFRQSPPIETQVPHWNQLLAEATGKYFVLLADDDELSPTYVSELAGLLDRHPQAAVAIAAQEILDEGGAVVRRTHGALPEVLPGGEFIRRAFHTYEWGFACFMTIFARTDEMRRSGGYPDFPQAQHGDDALLFKLCLGRPVVMSDRCAFRYRVYEASYGLYQDIRILAAATRQLLSFLKSDPQLREFASTSPEQWRELRGYLEQKQARDLLLPLAAHVSAATDPSAVGPGRVRPAIFPLLLSESRRRPARRRVRRSDGASEEALALARLLQPKIGSDHVHRGRGPARGRGGHSGSRWPAPFRVRVLTTGGSFRRCSPPPRNRRPTARSVFPHGLPVLSRLVRSSVSPLYLSVKIFGRR